MSSVIIVIILLSCAFVGLLIGIIIYCYRHTIRSMCGRAFHRKKRVHEITAPVRPSGENEIVLAVTQRREHPPLPPSSQRNSAPVVVSNNHGGSSGSGVVSGRTSLGRHNTVVGDGTYYQRHNIQRHHHHQPYLVSRHQSFNLYNNTGRIGRGFLHGSGSDLPSPFVSNLSSLQSLLMSSQVAIFDSSTERLSLSSQNNINPNSSNSNGNNNANQLQQQPITVPLLRQLQLRQSTNSRIGGVSSAAVASSTSPVTLSPAGSSFNVHLHNQHQHHAPQPSYFDTEVERPPSYQESVLIQKLRASDRGVGYNRRVPGNANRVDLSRRSFRM